METKLEVKDLAISFRTNAGTVKAVRNISFKVEKGETLAIVGESGSGKSVTAKAILGVLAANSIVEGGEILYDGMDLLKTSEEDFNELRGHRLSMIYQDPLSSLDPIMKIGKQMTEATIINGKTAVKHGRKKFKAALKQLEAALRASGHADVTGTVSALKEVLEAGGKDREAWQRALEYAESALHSCEELAVALKKDDSEAIKNETKWLQERTERAEDPRLTGEHTDALKRLSSGLPGTLSDLEALLSTLVKAPMPDFFRLAAEAKGRDWDALSAAVIDSESLSALEYLQEQAQRMAASASKQYAYDKAIRIMEDVGIAEPRKRFDQYPFEFSGGMRQRIVIAIAVAANPDVLICDEPTTALDVTIQAQILELIRDLKKKRSLTVIFITHDLGVVANIADKVAVMYAGKLVEYGTADDIFYEPAHPYTWALLSSMPDLDTEDRLESIPGTPPNMVAPPVGDAFAARNKYALAIDLEQEPPRFQISDTHWAATWLLHPKAPKVEMPQLIKDRIERMKAMEREEAEHGGQE